MIHQFELKLLPDPQSLLRVLGLFAQRQIVLQSVHCERRGDDLHMTMAAADMDAAMANNVAEKLRQLVVVVQAQLIDRTEMLAA
jgi:acetolactate synthase small subunit